MSDITIRTKLIPGDIGSIIKLHGEYYFKHNGFDATFEPYVAIPLAEFSLRQKATEKIWIAEEDKCAKGCIAIVDNGHKEAQLRWFILDEKLQGRGIGRQLIEKALAFTHEQKYERLVLWTVSNLEAAIRLYKHYGFTLTEVKTHSLWGQELSEQCYELVLNKE